MKHIRYVIFSTLLKDLIKQSKKKKILRFLFRSRTFQHPLVIKEKQTILCQIHIFFFFILWNIHITSGELCIWSFHCNIGPWKYWCFYLGRILQLSPLCLEFGWLKNDYQFEQRPYKIIIQLQIGLEITLYFNLEHLSIYHFNNNNNLPMMGYFDWVMVIRACSYISKIS